MDLIPYVRSLLGTAESGMGRFITPRVILLIECFAHTFVLSIGSLRVIDEDEVDLTEKSRDTRYIKWLHQIETRNMTGEGLYYCPNIPRVRLQDLHPEPKQCIHLSLSVVGGGGGLFNNHTAPTSIFLPRCPLSRVPKHPISLPLGSWWFYTFIVYIDVYIYYLMCQS